MLFRSFDRMTVPSQKFFYLVVGRWRKVRIAPPDFSYTSPKAGKFHKYHAHSLYNIAIFYHNNVRFAMSDAKITIFFALFMLYAKQETGKAELVPPFARLL